MNYAEILNQAYDAFADSEDKKAERLLQSIMDHLKKNLNGSDEDANRYYYWGLCQTAIEEYEQALLKFETVLQWQPEHEDALWQIASIFIYNMEKPASAKTIVLDKLLKLNPEDERYKEAADWIRFYEKKPKMPPPDLSEEVEA